jgi:hypothetical protein
MAVFPSIRPTGRSYSPGQFPTKTYRGLSGATVKRVFGNRSFGHVINLQFENISDANTKAILDHYYGQFGNYARFTLPDAAFSGTSSALKGVLQAPTNILWEYAEPPQVESVFNGRSTVIVRLVGELDYSGA